MRKATRVVAASLGVLAGIGGPEHGVFEILQGKVAPGGLVIDAMGPPGRARGRDRGATTPAVPIG